MHAEGCKPIVLMYDKNCRQLFDCTVELIINQFQAPQFVSPTMMRPLMNLMLVMRSS